MSHASTVVPRTGRSRQGTRLPMAAKKSSSAAGASRSAKAESLPVPPHLEHAWAQVTSKAMRDLFHPDPARRVAAAKLMREKFNQHAVCAKILLGAALAEPDEHVKTVLLDARA